MSKAEERALEAYPRYIQATHLYGTYDLNMTEREAFRKGYEQAEKDLALTAEDVRKILLIVSSGDWYDFEIHNKLWKNEFYEEVLKRFKEAKK